MTATRPGTQVEQDNAPTPTCALCGDPFWPEQAGQRYCSSRHRETARKRRQRSRNGREQLLVPLGTPLTDLYARATPPRLVNGDQGDDAGHLDDDEHAYSHEADNGPGAWSDIWRLQEAIEAVHQRYERRVQPYLAQLKRNPGVRPSGLVGLERQRDDEIAAVLREHDQDAEVGRARRNEPKRINEAHERQRERAALQALAQDLPGGSRRYEAPQHAGRATGDIWRW
jgi:predicted nucleic acid-binding Zn ribbon protein